jgi:hypothetical protein
MRHIAGTLLAALALGACATRPSSAPPPAAESPEAAACRAEARNAPEVRALGRQFNAENQANVLRIRQEAGVAEARAFRNCMVRRGAAMPGGVEPVRRPQP